MGEIISNNSFKQNYSNNPKWNPRNQSFPINFQFLNKPVSPLIKEMSRRGERERLLGRFCPPERN